MRLTVQRRLAGSIMRCSPKRVWFDTERLEDIKEAITKQDLKIMIAEGAIRERPAKTVSRGRARVQAAQKAKGLRRGVGSRKGKKTARLSKKRSWINKIRIQRIFLKLLRAKELIEPKIYQNLYLKSKGGFFRSKRHIKLYIDDQKLVKNVKE